MVAYYLCTYEKGKREKNEDSLAIHKIHTKAGEAVLALICDGCGGHQEGENASGYAVERLSTWFYDVLPGLMKSRKRRILQASIQNTLFRIHSRLKEYGEEKHIKLGTTVSGVLILERAYIIFWLGDTRIYRTGRKLKQLTRPHVSGRGISRCLGMGSFKKADMLFGRAVNGGFFICSDGLTGTVSESDIQGVTSKKTGEDRDTVRKGLDTLVKTALNRGEGDNISALYIKLVR